MLEIGQACFFKTYCPIFVANSGSSEAALPQVIS